MQYHRQKELNVVNLYVVTDKVEVRRYDVQILLQVSNPRRCRVWIMQQKRCLWIFSIDPPTDEAVADFLRFLDKYVSLNYGHRALAKYFKLNRDKSLVDKITTKDIAISILIYENSVDVWEEDQRKKEDPNFHPTPAAVPKYHVKKGVHVLFVLQMDGQTKAVHTTRVYVLKSNVSRALNSFGRVSRNIGRPTPRHTTGHTVNICTASCALRQIQRAGICISASPDFGHERQREWPKSGLVTYATFQAHCF